MKKNRLDLQTLVQLSLFAGLIFLSIQYFRIPMGTQFIHFGNALVIVGCLLYGSRLGFLAAAVGLGIFDLLNGYAAEIPIILFEALVVAGTVYLIHGLIFKGKDTPPALLTTAIAGALIKIVLNLGRYSLIAYLAGNTSVWAALGAGLDKIPGTIGTSIATIIAVPILYPLFKEVRQRLGQTKRLQGRKA